MVLHLPHMLHWHHPCHSTCTTTCISYTTNSTSCATYSHTANSSTSCTTIQLVAFQTRICRQVRWRCRSTSQNKWLDGHTYISRRCQSPIFCLTLVGEARLWYGSLRPINVDWAGLQNQFKQQYSKMGNMREQLSHAWRSFHFDANTKTLDSYVTCIRQVAIPLGYSEQLVLEIFKNTLPTRLYWVLFPIEDLRQAVETTKRTLTKEKIDRQ